MTEQEAQAMLMQAHSVDQSQAEAADAAVGIVPAKEDPDAAAKEWLIIPEIIAWGITMALPEAAECYTDTSKLELAKKIAPVAEKYGWNGPGNMPELALVVGAIGFSMPAVLAYRARKEAKAEEEADNGS